MVMSWCFTVMAVCALASALFLGRGSELAASIPQGAQAGITTAISIAGSICLWSGLGRLMEACGVLDLLSKLMKPLLRKLFPQTVKNRHLAGALSSNICANILGLGNAATPPGLQAARLLADGPVANDQLCRLIVLNTASIQLIPTTVAAIRSSMGCQTPFDILPAVWITSFSSATIGVFFAWLMGRLWKK